MRTVANASSFSTVMISSRRLTSRIAGTNPAPIPWIGCGPLAPPDSTGDAAGSTATSCTEGLRSFSTWPTPVIVPPVPTPATTMSTRPSVSDQIVLGGRLAVNRRVGGVLELLGDEEATVALGDLLRLGDGTTHAHGPRREDELGA